MSEGTQDGRTYINPADHRVLADADINKMRALGPESPQWDALALSAQAHYFGAVAAYLDVLTRVLDPDDVTEAEVRLPGHRTVRAEQSAEGALKWGYVISGPGEPGQPSSRFVWDSKEAALAAGICAANGVLTASAARGARARARATERANGQHAGTGGQQ
jgi:hypothetical protein